MIDQSAHLLCYTSVSISNPGVVKQLNMNQNTNKLNVENPKNLMCILSQNNLSCTAIIKKKFSIQMSTSLQL